MATRKVEKERRARRDFLPVQPINLPVALTGLLQQGLAVTIAAAKKVGSGQGD